MKKWRVILADDHQLFSDGIRLILNNYPTYEIVGAVNSGKALLELVNAEEVELVITDINMPEMDGVEITRLIKKNHPNIYVLVVSMYSHISYIKKLMRIGVDGYILKENGQADLLAALTAIRAGNKFYSAEVLKSLTDSFDTSQPKSGLYQTSLSKREFEVLQLVAQGLTTAAISEKLFVAPSTIVSHRKNIMQKLEVKNVAEMIRTSTEMGLLV